MSAVPKSESAEKSIEIFVSYFFKKNNGGHGCGNAFFNVSEVDSSTIREIEDHIKESSGFENVIILNWTVMG